jgi:hypothetical protein
MNTWKADRPSRQYTLKRGGARDGVIPEGSGSDSQQLSRGPGGESIFPEKERAAAWFSGSLGCWQ